MLAGTEESLLRGAIDMHIHSSPDIQPRKLSDLEVARAYKSAGLKGVLIKCHITPTTSRAAIAREAIGDFQVYGGLVLNKAAGGLNPAAVEVELRIGAKEIWMPTVSSKNHIMLNNGDKAQAVTLVDDKGAFRAELYEIFELIAKKDAILGTGHLSSDECEKVVAAAQERGVKKILVTHPEYEMPAMSIDTQKKLARKGVFFERCFFASNPAPQQRKVPSEVIAEQIKAVGAEVSIMASDFGQEFNEEPLAGFRRYILTMLDLGVSSREIEQMVKKNPAALLGV